MVRTGRPSKFSKEKAATIVTNVASGASKEAAAQSVGISKPTLYRWLDKGKSETSGNYRDFLNAIEKAEGDAELLMTLQIIKATDKSWQAAAWWLERRRPQNFPRPRDMPPYSDIAPGPSTAELAKMVMEALGDEDETTKERILQRMVKKEDK